MNPILSEPLRHNSGVQDLPPGAELAGCRIDGVAGRGGMGIVYRATQLSLGRPVALKLIAARHAADPAFRERFQREARLAAAIDHPNVVPVHEAGEEDGLLYLIMRYVRGTDLHALLAKEGRLAPPRAAAIVDQVAAALDAAHAAGLVHRDVKPGNVLIAGEPGNEHVYLTDFGLTRQLAPDMRLTTTGHWIGTVDFTAPELARSRDVDARSDVYALGCVLHVALTGEVPYPRGTVPATLLAHLRDPPPRPSRTPGVPTQFDPVIARALAKAPADRYPSAGDLGRAALAAAVHEPVDGSERSVARGPAAPEDAGEPSRSRDAAPAAAGDGPYTGATAALPPDPTAHKPAMTLPDGRPGARRRTRRRLRRVALAGLVAAGAIAVMAAADVGGLLGNERSPHRPVAAGEVRDTVNAFAAAYESEDVDALGRLLARRVDRVFPGAQQRGRSRVLAEYRRQFADDDTREYRLEDLDVKGGAVGRASGTYRAELANDGQITGRIVFGVVREQGEPRIGLIAATPDV
jgi:hypothetical protein